MKNISMCFLFKMIYLFCLFAFNLTLFINLECFATDINITLNVVPGQITYGSPTYLNLGQIDISSIQQETQGQFDDYFWVSDLASSDTGYNTTIVSDGLIGPNSAILTGIYLMAGNNGNPELLNGVSGDVKINSVFSGSYYSIFSNPVTYIYRQQGANYGKINKYGDKPWIKVVTPGYMQPGTYSGTIYFDI